MRMLFPRRFAEYFRTYDAGLGVETDSLKFYSCRDVDSGPLMHRYEPPEEGFHVWPVYFTHTHRGRAPISGRKYIINKWGFPVKL